MGGFGSGRWKKRGRKMVGSCWELDANYLSARGCLEPGWSGQWTDGNEVASINLRAEAGQLCLSWRGEERDEDGEREDMAEIIPIVRVPCQLGGTRPYFLCPGVGAVGCGRRVIKLYLSRRRFLCRQCSRLVYASRYEKKPWQRAYRHVDKLARRLARADAPPLAKSHRAMPADTYAQLLDELLRAELLAYEAVTDDLQQLIARLDKKHSRRRKPQFTL